MNILKSFEAEFVKSLFQIINKFIDFKSNFKKKTLLEKKIVILTLPHTMYVANTLRYYLGQLGYKVHIELKSRRKIFTHDYYVVICPQEFKYLPPQNKRISMQMEQCVSDWFNEKYIQTLNSSLQVWDYSQSNIRYFQENNIALNKAFYIPLTVVPNYREHIENLYGKKLSTAKTVDFLFYGNIDSDRRQRLLQQLSSKFKVRIETNLYGFDMLDAISSAKIILNIHFYENALLETTRIFECLSLGSIILSEASPDLHEYEDLVVSKSIEFFKIGDVNDMLEKAEALLQHYNEIEKDYFEHTQNILKQNLIFSLQQIKPL